MVWMDTQASSHPSSTVASPTMVTWRLAERRGRKAGSGNIFGGVNLWQLQRLFRAAGDQDAEQRAQLVWGQGDEAELAQALIGLRARSRRRGLRAEARDGLGSRWMKAFNHLRIGDVSASSQVKDPVEGSNSEGGGHGNTEPQSRTLKGTERGGAEATDSQGPAGPPERPSRAGLRKGRDKDPERYLHRILH